MSRPYKRKNRHRQDHEHEAGGGSSGSCSDHNKTVKPEEWRSADPTVLDDIGYFTYYSAAVAGDHPIDKSE